MLATKAGVQVFQVLQAPDEQRRAHEQQKGECHLRRDEEPVQPPGPGAGGILFQG